MPACACAHSLTHSRAFFFKQCKTDDIFPASGSDVKTKWMKINNKNLIHICEKMASPFEFTLTDCSKEKVTLVSATITGSYEASPWTKGDAKKGWGIIKPGGSKLPSKGKDLLKACIATTDKAAKNEMADALGKGDEFEQAAEVVGVFADMCDEGDEPEKGQSRYKLPRTYKYKWFIDREAKFKTGNGDFFATLQLGVKGTSTIEEFQPDREEGQEQQPVQYRVIKSGVNVEAFHLVDAQGNDLGLDAGEGSYNNRDGVCGQLPMCGFSLPDFKRKFTCELFEATCSESSGPRFGTLGMRSQNSGAYRELLVGLAGWC